MAQSRFENGPRGWRGEESGGYAGDRFRESRDEGYRSRDDDSDFRRGSGRDDRERQRFEGGQRGRGFDDYRGGEDRWNEGGQRGGGFGGSYSGGFGGYGGGGFDSDERRGFGGGGGSYGQDYGRGDRGGYGQGSGQDYGRGQGSGSYGGGWDAGRRGGDYGSGQRYGENRERGFFERASDAVMSWVGDEDATRRREADHRGKGPRGYQRSDERIRDDVNDRLSDDPRVDASNIDVSVQSGEVTLTGEVTSKSEKRHAEDVADSVSGVRHVQNNLRVSQSGSQSFGSSGLHGSGPGAGGSGQSAPGFASDAHLATGKGGTGSSGFASDADLASGKGGTGGPKFASDAELASGKGGLSGSEGGSGSDPASGKGGLGKS